MIIALDGDGVVMDLHPEWLRRYNRDYNDTLDITAVTSWDMHKFVKPECGKKVYNYLHDEDLYLNVPVVPGALEGVKALREAGHKVVFASSCVMGMTDQKLTWLIGNGFLTSKAKNFPEYMSVSDKSMIRADLLVDDGVHNVDAFIGTAILFDQPFNRESTINSQWSLRPLWRRRAFNWKEVVSYAEEVAKWAVTSGK